MEETSQTLTKPRNSTNACRNLHPHRNADEANDSEDDDNGKAEKELEDEKCDKEAWDSLSKSFKQVQAVLDQNRALIQEVNANHQSKTPDNLVKNVALIREINGNISKVMSLYSDLSLSFSNIVHQRRPIMGSNSDGDKERSNINTDDKED